MDAFPQTPQLDVMEKFRSARSGSTWTPSARVIQTVLLLHLMSMMSDDDWTDGHSRTVTLYLNGSALPDVDLRGEPVTDDSFLLLMNGHDQTVSFRVPDVEFGRQWQVELDTAAPVYTGDGPRPRQTVRAGASRRVPGRGLVLLRRKPSKP